MLIGASLLVLLDKSTAVADIAATLSGSPFKAAFLQVLTCSVTASPDALATDGGTAFWGHLPQDATLAEAEWTEAIASQVDASGRTQEIGHIIGSWQDLCRKIRQKARYCDLIVFGQGAETLVEVDRIALIEETLMTSGRPVLLLSEQGPIVGSQRPKSGRMIIGWDESDAALAAARAAIPILKGDDVTHILSIDPNATSTERSDVGGGLARYLGLHGVQCEVIVASKPQGSSVSDVLLARAEDADLLVMGGYGHSRLREMVFGGATRDVIRQTKIPVLLAR